MKLEKLENLFFFCVWIFVEPLLCIPYTICSKMSPIFQMFMPVKCWLLTSSWHHNSLVFSTTWQLAPMCINQSRHSIILCVNQLRHSLLLCINHSMFCQIIYHWLIKNVWIKFFVKLYFRTKMTAFISFAII